MKLLIAIPHFCRAVADNPAGYDSLSGDVARRAKALERAILSLWQHFGPRQGFLNLEHAVAERANEDFDAGPRIVVVVHGDDHALAAMSIPESMYEVRRVECSPMVLGFEAHRVLGENVGRYDWYGYIEDDLVVHDSFFFDKMAWFEAQAGDDAILQPNRFELSAGPVVHKFYVDGDLKPRVRAAYANIARGHALRLDHLGTTVRVETTHNPHSGCFFLSRKRMERWAAAPFFLDGDCSFLGPLESAATLGLIKMFARVYKPSRAHARFLEIEHASPRFTEMIGGLVERGCF